MHVDYCKGHDIAGTPAKGVLAGTFITGITLRLQAGARRRPEW